MIEASQRMLRINSQGEIGGMSPPVKKDLELQIKTLQKCSRDADKLEKLLKSKEKECEKSKYALDIERLSPLHHTFFIIPCFEIFTSKGAIQRSCDRFSVS